MARSRFWCGAFVLLAVLGVAQLAADELVLDSGRKITVATMRVVGQQVYVTMPDGRMQAYRLDDVDLTASGLEPAGETRKPDRPERPADLASIANRDRGGARISITDEDVDHVTPAVAGEGGEGASASAEETVDELIVQVRDSSRSGSQLRVDGIVSNGADFPVRRIELMATAVDTEGQSVGTGRTSVAGELPPGGAASFAIMVALTGEPAGVNVGVTGALASARIARPEVPEQRSDSGEQQPESEPPRRPPAEDGGP